MSAAPQLQELAPGKMDMGKNMMGYALCDGLGAAIFWFIIIAVVAYLILFSTNPNFVRKGDGSGAADPGKVLLASIVIALIIVVILWLIKSCSKMY